MLPKANWRRAESERERRRFRFSLAKDILRCETVRALSSDQKKMLFMFLSSGWSAAAHMSSETSRIRALEKAASDARRLRASLNRLEAKDSASLDSNYKQSIPFSTRILMMQELEHDASALAKVIRGEQKEIALLRRKRTAVHLVETLCGFRIPCRIRNDHDVADCNATTAMRCVMFSMLEAGVKELSWSAAASIIKLGLRELEGQTGKQNSFVKQMSWVTPREADAVRLFMLEDPFWNGLRLET